VDDLIAIRGIRVVDSEKGLFVSMPQSQDKKTNEYHDIAFPLTGDLRKEISQAVLNEYDRTASLSPDERGYEKSDTDAAKNINTADIKLDIRVYPLADPQGKTKAFASVSVEDLIAIRGVRVVEGEKGLYVAMPQSQDKDKNFRDIAFPLNGDLRKEINRAILSEFGAIDKSMDKKSLADGLRDGAAKAAVNSAAPRAAAKTQAGVLE
jgi:stage V sporulation protein G